ncbi:unnamed protein product [Adineta ricciae]|uniref:G-protein coupled receptors family 1 profile domain-containing protein n=1 Tax=Adineta ricciae TaxID=249248 RepID=A0A814AE26_ADIRI|nr:unnamed protein product [Adineta ricciae]CAF0933339.1 unnamed protein product [Adineta ricciae]
MFNTSLYASEAELFDYLSIQMDRYFALFIFFFAVIGNTLNILVLSQPTLRSNPCAWLFLTSSIANLITVLFALTTRIMAGWGTDPTDTQGWICKLRAFILFSSRTIAFWLIALATVDRCMASSPNAAHRRMNTLKNIQKIFLLVVIVSILLYSQIFYCYEANLILTPLKCYGKSPACRLFTDVAYGCVSILLPLLCMIVFGMRTIYHIHQVQSRVQPVHVTNADHHQPTTAGSREHSHNPWKKHDRHLFLMLIVQVIIQSILTIPQVIAKFYISATMGDEQTPLKLSIDHFLYNFALLLSFLANGMPFYIYTLCGGNIFRQPLLNLTNMIIAALRQRR